MSDTREAVVEAIFKGLEGGAPVGPILAMLGISRHTWWDWTHDNPEWGERYARAQETWAERLVEDCVDVAKDALLDPKSRRVIVDTNLRVAALMAPKRFSQTALDRLVAPPPEDVQRSPEEIALRMVRAMNVAGRIAALPSPDVVDGDFDEV